MDTKFTFGAALKIIFKYIQASPTVLAEQYVDRDRTLVYKWLRDTSFPPKKLFPDIIRFVMKNSSEPMRVMIRTEMEELLSGAELNTHFGKTLDGEADFTDFLESVFSLLTAEKALEKSQKLVGAAESADKQKKSDDPTSGATPEELFQSLAPSAGMRDIHIRLTSKTMIGIGFALLAAVSGELLWQIACYILRLPVTTGIPSGEASIFPALLRGFFVFPIIVSAMISLRGESSYDQALLRSKKIVIMFCYAIAGGIGGLLLASPGLEIMVEGFLPSPVPQAVFLVFIHALVISFLPLCVTLALLRFPKLLPGTFILIEFSPALLCALAALPVLFIEQSSTGRIWLGGLLPGLVLSFLMFISVRLVLKKYPDTIKLDFHKFPWQ